MKFGDLASWLRWMESLHPREIELGLDRLFPVAARLPHLADSVTVYTVAGTNGKGSSVAVLEAVLAGYPEVKAAYVVGLPDAERGQVVAAAVVPAATDVSAEALRVRLKGDLSAYKVPRYILLAEEGSLPFKDSGKIDKRGLTELLEGRFRDPAAG